MTQAPIAHGQLFAHDVFSLLQSIDPSRFRDEMREAVVERIRVLTERARGVGGGSGVGEQVARVAEVLESAPVSERARGEWESFRRRLHTAYDDLAAQLRAESVEVPTVRPTNHVRSLFHVASALGALALVQHVLSPRGMVYVAGGFAVSGWAMETSRRLSPAANRVLMWVFGPVAHEHERRRVNSATWYTTALFLMSLTLSPMACSVGLAVLGLADPAAGLVGRRFGRTKLRPGRSLEGSSTFVAVAFASALATLAIYYPTLGAGAMLAMSLAAAVPAALVELFVTKVDDNFTIPITAAAGCATAAALLGL